jgi:NADH/F420H2 dehydrogenase subunit C
MKKKDIGKLLFEILPFFTLQNQKDTIVASLYEKNVSHCLRFLRDFSLGLYKVLTSISVVDYPHRKLRFEVVYDLCSLNYNHRFRLKTFVHEKNGLDSVIPIYTCANWWEREAYDLFGVFFRKHTDLRRLLSDYGFEGHPLRKDFPCGGYLDLRYDDLLKKVVVDRLKIDQAYRQFSYASI